MTCHVHNSTTEPQAIHPGILRQPALLLPPGCCYDVQRNRGYDAATCLATEGATAPACEVGYGCPGDKEPPCGGTGPTDNRPLFDAHDWETFVVMLERLKALGLNSRDAAETVCGLYSSFRVQF